MTDAEKAKQDLEIRKLQLEISSLQDEPERDRRNRRISTFTAVLSTVTTMLVAAATAIVTLQVQRFSDRQHASDSYSKLLQDLGSSNVPARAGAVVGLTPFALNQDPDHSAQTVTLLVEQLTSESDFRVLTVLVPAITRIGTTAISEVARANRTAQVHFVDSARQLVLSKLGSLNKYSGVPNGMRGNAFVRDCEKAFDETFASIQPELNADVLTDRERNSIGMALSEPAELADIRLSNLLRDLAGGLDGTFGELSSGLLGFPEGTRLSKDAQKQQAAIFREQSRAVFLTGVVLGRLLKAASGHASTISLDGVAILGADLQGVRLDGIKMRDSFVAGDLSRSSLIHADLIDTSFTSLSQRQLYLADFSFANLVHTVLPMLPDPAATFEHESTEAGDAKRSYPRTVVFTGADWWDTVNALAGQGEEGVPVGVKLEWSKDSGGSEVLFTCGQETYERRGKAFSISMFFCSRFGNPTQFAKTLESAYPRAENEKRRAAAAAESVGKSSHPD